MYGLIGVGQCGGNLADEAIEMNIPSIAINYSERDLDSLENVVDKLQLVGSEGMDKERERAIELMKNNWELATSFVKKHMSAPSIEVIMVAFSTGGGSGSGISPILIELLQREMPNKTFVAVPVLPSKDEVIINQINTLNALEELSNLDVATFPIDNEKIKQKYGNISKNRLYKIVNQSFVKLLNELISYTEKHSKHGIIDKKDLLQIFNTKGIGIISETNIATISADNVIVLSSDGFAHVIQHSWEESIFSSIEMNKVVRAGIIFDAQERFMDYMDYNKIFNYFNNGMPLDLFEGNYTEEKGKVISILTGLSWINSRLKEIDELIEEKKSTITVSEEETYQSKNNTKDFTSKLTKRTKPKRSVSDILSKYQR